MEIRIKEATFFYKNAFVSYSDQGKGNTVVLLHGFLENKNMWDFFVSTLVLKNRIITIDLLGHGKTECIGYVHQMEEMATSVYFLLKSLKIKKTAIIGHSMGGYVGLAFMDLYSNSTQKLLLLNSTYKKDSSERILNRNRAIEAVKTNKDLFIKIAIQNLFNSNTAPFFEKEIASIIKEALGTSIQGIIAAIEGMKARKDYTALVSESKIPIWIILGKNDPVLPYKDMYLSSELSGISVKTLADGHMSHVENRDDLINLLIDFLNPSLKRI